MNSEKELTTEEVLHVARLARIEISEEELLMYQRKLKELLDQVEIVKDIDDHEEKYLISPWNDKTQCRSDVEGKMLDPKEALKNVPRKSGNYIQVPVVINHE